MGMLDNVFDTSSLLADERTRIATAAAGLPKGSGTVYLAAEGGERMAQGVRSMFGIEEPAVTKVKNLQSILQKYESGINTAEQALSAASELRMGGYLDYAKQMEEFAVSLANAETNRINANKTSTSTTDPNIAAQRLLEIDAAKWLTNDANKPGYKHNLENWKRQLETLWKEGYFDTDTYKQLQKQINDEDTKILAEEKSIDSDVIKMGDRWVKNANIPQTEAALVRLENVLAKYPGKTDIPGIDLFEKWVTATVLGNVFNMPMGVEAAEVVSALAAVSNALLKERSGAAVTPHEFERFQEEIRGGAFASDSAVRTFVRELRIALDSEKAQISGAFRKEVRHRYWFQSGYYKTYDTPEDVPANLPSGSYYFSPDGILRRKK